METVDRVYNVSKWRIISKRMDHSILNIAGGVLFHATMIRIFHLSIILWSGEVYIN